MDLLKCTRMVETSNLDVLELQQLKVEKLREQLFPHRAVACSSFYFKEHIQSIVMGKFNCGVMQIW